MRHFLGVFFTWFWLLWLLELVLVDPLCVYLGKRYGVGDKFTDTHFLVIHIPMGLRVAIIAWMAYHFFIAHQTS